MHKNTISLALAVAFGVAAIHPAVAAVTAEQAERLGQDLTCVGAERAGNADGTIPEYKGLYVGEVPGWLAEPHSGAHPIDPYADDQPMLIITAQNVEQYAQHLTEGRSEERRVGKEWRARELP